TALAVYPGLVEARSRRRGGPARGCAAVRLDRLARLARGAGAARIGCPSQSGGIRRPAAIGSHAGRSLRRPTAALAQPRKYFSGPAIFHVPSCFRSSIGEGAAVTHCATTVARSPWTATLLIVPPSVDGLWVSMALMQPLVLWNTLVTSVFDR